VCGSKGKPLTVVADARAIGPALQFAVIPPDVHAAVAAAAAAAAAPVEVVMEPEEGVAGLMSCAGSSEAVAPAAAAAAFEGEPPPEAGAGCPDVAIEKSAANRNSASGSKAGSTKPSTGALRTGKARASVRAAAAPAALVWAAAPAVGFGRIEVLKKHSQHLRLRNMSPVDAHAKLFIEGRESVFQARPCVLLLLLVGSPADTD
jgi:hypothetical protein